MKVIRAIFLAIMAAAQLDAVQPWTPEVSLKESWRWSALDSLTPYEIICGANGLNGEIWFVYYGGLISYNGIDITNHPVPELTDLPIRDVFVASDGRVIVTCRFSYILWENGGYRIVQVPGNLEALRGGIVQGANGQIFMAATGAIYELDGHELREVATDVEDVTSLLLDANGKLWVSESGGRPIKVYQLNRVAEKYFAVVEHLFPTSGLNNLGPWLFMDSSGKVWVFDPDENDQCFYYEDYARKPAFRGLRENLLLSQAFDVIETRPGELWFCVSRNLVRWNGLQLEVYEIEDYPVPSTYPYVLALGAERILLGGQKLTPKVIDLSTERLATYKDLNFQCEDTEGGYWFIAKNRKVACLHLGQWMVGATGDGIIDTPNRIIAGSDGSIWVSGAHQGQAAVAVRINGNWQRHQFPEIGKTFSHLAAIETQAGEFIFGGGTPANLLGDAPGGAVIFHKAGDSYAGIHYPPPSFTARTANLVERPGDGLLFSVGSVFKMRSNSQYLNQTEKLFKNPWIDHMIVDSSNNLWVACVGDGVYKHDGVAWEYHGYDKGLGTKNVVFLLEDRLRGRILALTDDGLYAYDGVRWGRSGPDFGMRFIRENHMLFEPRDGALWLNFTNRRWLLERKDFGQHTYDFQTIRYMPEREPPQTYANVSSATFPEGSQIQVVFRGNDYWDQTPVDELVYSWTVNGAAWTGFHKQPSVILEDLPSGRYEVHVRARDLDGNIDASPAVISFAVIPPLWKQAWFILLMLAGVLLILFLLYTLYRIRIKAALALDEFKLDFFTNISHELRNPLAVIMSPVEALLESTTDSGVRHKLQMVLRNARKMQSMVDQLLDFRKIEKKRWNIVPESGEIVSFTRDVISEHEPRWQAKHQSVTVDVSTASHPCSFDSGILQKVVDNLLSNAIKYSGDNTAIRVAVGIESADGHATYVLSVTDEGPGIPLHEQRNVLQPFYRVKRDTAQEGSGVGLAMVNQLVSLWGGKLEIESPLTADGRGTRFTVKLPLDPYKEAKPQEPSAASARGDREQKPTLLFIDDNEDMRHILVDAFAGDYRTLEAGDGTTGADLALKHNPDLVVSDVMMPGMDGYALCEKLKTDPETSHIPVILLTARGSVEDRIDGIKAGADAYIAKPLDVKHLKARVENLLESRRELRQKFAKQLVIEATEITVTPTDELILQKAIKIVEENMADEEFDLKRFGQLMGMSRSTMTRKFKSITGLSPLAFIHKLRLKRAAHLLTTSDLGVSDIGAMVGFYDPSYFGKVFKKEYGMSPSAYAGK